MPDPKRPFALLVSADADSGGDALARAQVARSERDSEIPRQVGRAFRQLSDEHIAEKRRDDPEVTWQAIQRRMQLDAGLLVGHEGKGGSRRAGFFGGRLAALAAAAAVLLAVGGAGWLAYGSENSDALSYRVSDASGHELGAGLAGTSQLLATESEARLVRFSDTSVIELRPYTTLRVSLVPGGAVVARLVQGSLKVDVHHHDLTDYRFQAGDYEVKVVGTAFDLAFEPEPARFDLNLREGRVVVADRSGQTRFVRAGEQLHLPTLPTLLARRGGEPTPALSSAVREADAPEADVHHKATAAGTRAAESAAPSYRDLARRGEFQAIVTAARRTGIERVLAAKGPSELHELAQAARYTGQTALAEKVFFYLGSQHARAPEGRGAAFFRGRLAEDGGRLSQAQQHYHAYLSQGGGAYAAEALGRELTLVQKLKGPAAARPLANEYLRRFPRGAYRDLARTLALGSATAR